MEKSKFNGWLYIGSGIGFNGLVGLGEVMEHSFDPFLHDFFHYIHIYAGMICMFLVYLGVNNLLSMEERRIKGDFESYSIVYLAIIFLVVLSLVTFFKTSQNGILLLKFQ